MGKPIAFMCVFMLAQIAQADDGNVTESANVRHNKDVRNGRRNEGLSAVVRGFYVVGGVAGGYMVSNAVLRDNHDPNEAGVSGSEGYGAGFDVQIGLGYDVTEWLAIMAVGGSSQISGRRQDRVRDVQLTYVGIGPKLALAVAERLRVMLGFGPAQSWASNHVEAPEQGMAVFGSLGVMFDVHVRHFAIGMEVFGLNSFEPKRTLVNVGPQLKYTF